MQSQLVGLERNGAIAVHEQLSGQLRTEVGAATPGSRLPTEEDLMARYGVSRTTVRRAVQTLVNEEMLVRRQGKGTFVASQRPVQTIDQLAPFVESFTASGLRPVVTLLQYDWVSGAEALDGLGEAEESVLRLRRLYRANDLPQAVADIYVPERFGRLLSRADAEEHPIYQLLQERAHHDPHHAEITLTCAPASEDVAGQLEVPATQALPRLQRITRAENGEWLECMVARLRPESFELRTVVTAQLPHPVSYNFEPSNGHRAAVPAEQSTE